MTVIELGFSRAGDPQPCMVLIEGESPSLPARLDARRLPGLLIWLSWAELVTEVFGFPLHVAQAATYPDTLDRGDVEWFISWDGATPVATSMLVHIGDVASVVNVASLPHTDATVLALRRHGRSCAGDAFEARPT